jgi:hypothetical protein
MRVKTVITGLVAIVWVGSVYSLHKRTSDRSFLEDGARVDVVTDEFIVREDYLGVYLNDQKIGYSAFVLKEAGKETASAAGGRVYLFTLESALQINAMGISVPVKIYSFGSVDEGLRLRDFSFSFEASGQRITSVGVVEGNVLRVTTRSEGSEHVQEYPITGSLYSPDVVHLVAARQGLAPGKEWTFPIYDALTTSTGDVTIRVGGRETIEWAGEKRDTYHLTLSYKGLQEDAWVNEGGDVYREQSSIGGISFVAARETKDQALRLEPATTISADLIAASTIPVERQIDDPAQVKLMTAVVSGCQPSDLVFDGIVQTLGKTDPDGSFIVTVRRPDYASVLEQHDTPEVAYAGSGDFRAYLEPEPLIQSHDERVRAKAREISEGAATRWEAVARISDWLHTSIRKEPRVTIPSAVEVLQSLRGDCNEHSTLFTALARSLGIPTKLCAGIVYQEGAFYYHAWNEVLIGDNDPVWLPVDSTLGRTYVDATHLKLNEGSLDKQVELVKLIGTIRLRILDVS